MNGVKPDTLAMRGFCGSVGFPLLVRLRRQSRKHNRSAGVIESCTGKQVHVALPECTSTGAYIRYKLSLNCITIKSK